MKRDTREKQSSLTIFLHWVVALTIIGLLTSGVYMVQAQAYPIYPWHKSFGVLITVFVLVRVVWRIINVWPEEVGDSKVWERILARTVHYILIVGSILLPVSGMAMSARGGYGIDVFGFSLVAKANLPEAAGLVFSVNKEIAGTANQAHMVIGYILIACVFLHVAGALKHEVIDKQGILRRMLGT